jgi:Cobalamin-independent synthase, Catalytic domain
MALVVARFQLIGRRCGRVDRTRWRGCGNWRGDAHLSRPRAARGQGEVRGAGQGVHARRSPGSDYARRSRARAPENDDVLAKLPSKTIILGVLDLSDMVVEPPEVVADRIRRALPYVDAARIVIAPDCGLKYLPRDVAFGKMQAMVQGALIVRAELS